MKDKKIYEEKYRKPYPTIRKDALPILKHIDEEFKVVAMELRAAGKIERNGKELEYNDFRVYLEES